MSILINSNDEEKIENEYDIYVADEAYKEYIADGKRSTPISELDIGVTE